MLVLAGGTRTATHASLAAAAVAARSASAESTAMQQARGLHALGTSNNLHASPTSPARPDALAAAPSPSAGAEGIDVECDAGLLHDSFQLSLLLGKAVAASLGAGGAMRAAGEVRRVDMGIKCVVVWEGHFCQPIFCEFCVDHTMISMQSCQTHAYAITH